MAAEGSAGAVALTCLLDARSPASHAAVPSTASLRQGRTLPSAPFPASPQVPVGRRDAVGPDPDGRMPAQDASAEQQIANFAAKGLSAQELVVLSGSHTVGRQGRGAAGRGGHTQAATQAAPGSACRHAGVVQAFCQAFPYPESILTAWRVTRLLAGFTSPALTLLPADPGAPQLGSKGYGDPVTFDNTYFKTLLAAPWKDKSNEMAQHMGGGAATAVTDGRQSGPHARRPHPPKLIPLSALDRTPSFPRPVVPTLPCPSAARLPLPPGIPTDHVLADNPELRPHIQRYADSQAAFFADFAAAYPKMAALGARWA